MIFGHIANTAPEQYPTPVANAVAYLQRTDFSVLPAGRYEDPATGYVVQVLDLHTQPPDALRPEVHRQNVDVQFLVSGTELIGVAADNGDNVIHQSCWRSATSCFIRTWPTNPGSRCGPATSRYFFRRTCIARPALTNAPARYARWW